MTAQGWAVVQSVARAHGPIPALAVVAALELADSKWDEAATAEYGTKARDMVAALAGGECWEG